MATIWLTFNHSPNTNFMAGSPTGPDEFGQRVQAVRRFNRFYTRQIGVLQEGLLNSSLSLSEVRVLYELAHREKPTAAELCKELELDAGYLSRILRAFHKRGWILRESSQHDARRSLLSLSRRGRAAFEPLNARSNQEVAKMLGALAPSQQSNIVEAMQTIESTLLPGTPEKAPYLLRTHQAGDIGWWSIAMGYFIPRSTDTTSASRPWWRESWQSSWNGTIRNASDAGLPRKMASASGRFF